MKMYRSISRAGAQQFIYGLILLVMALLVPAEAFAAGDLTLFGPKRFERSQGKPWVFTDSFNGCANSAGQALLRVQNGAGKDSSLSSALITLNGTNVLVEADFKNQTAVLERTVTIRPGINTLATQLKSGGQKATPFLVVTVTGLGCDSTPPVISAPQPTEGALLNSSRPVIAASYADNSGGTGIDTASVRVILDGSDITSACTVGATAVSCTPPANLPEGGHNVTLAVADLLQNPATFSWRFTTDTVAPLAAITTPTNNQYLASRSVTVSGSIDDQAATITLNGKAATISGALFSVADVPLAEGSNTLTLIATDLAGNRTESSVTVTVDTSLPQIVITSPINGSFTGSSPINVSGTVSELPASFTINGAAVAVSSSLTFDSPLNLVEGLNTITVQASDRAGNPGSVIGTVNFDTVKPVISITTPANGILTKNPSLTVSGTVSEPVTSLTVNGSSTTSTPLSTSPLTDLTFAQSLTLLEGQNTIILETVDRAGNSGEATLLVTLDSTPPTAPLLESLTTPTNRSSATVAGSAEPWSSLSLYNGAERVATVVTPVDGRFNFAEMTLHEGENSFSVTALDLAGNESAPSTPVTVFLDTVKPLVTITAPLDKALLNTPVITLSGPIDDPAAIVTVNGLPALNSGGAWTIEGFTLQEGSNSLLLEARDPAGNLGTAVIAVILDTTPPLVKITSHTSGQYLSAATINLSGTLDDPTAKVTVNGVAALVTAGSFALNGINLAEGENTLAAEAIDPAGNPGTDSITLNLDTVKPVIIITSPANSSFLNTPQITVSGTVSEPVTSLTVNGRSTPLTDLSFTQSVTLAEGSNLLPIIAFDLAGNEGIITVPLTLDTIAPQLSVSTLSDGAFTNNETLNISGTVTDVGGLDKLLINSVIVPVNSDGSYSHAFNLKTGPNVITVEAFDKAANKSSDSRTVNLDQTAPGLTITTPADNSKTGVKQIEVSGTVDEEVTTLTINGQPATVNGLTFTATIIPVYGYNTVEITARDRAGNPGSQKRTVIFDDKKPAVAITAPVQDLRTNNSSLILKGTAADADSLTAVSVTITSGGESFTPLLLNGAFEQAISFTEEKVYAIIVTAKDEVGNETSIQRNIIYDITPPAVTVNQFTAPVNQTSQLISGSREAGTTVVITSSTATIGEITYPTDTTWQATVTGLGGAINDITVTAADNAGNLGNTATQILYDTTPPGIMISAPLANSFHKTPLITVSGSVSEAVTAVTVNGQPATVNGTSTSLSTGLNFTAAVTLIEGANNISVNALDPAGNSGTATLPLTLDTTPPGITISAPLANSFHKTPQLTVSGSVSEAVTAVTVNGQPATVNGLTFTSPLTLLEGANSLIIRGLDRAGNEGVATFLVNLDTAAPVVTIATPVAGLLTKTPQVMVSGTVSEEQTSVTVNGQPATVNGSTFTATITLSEGGNTITVKAFDRAGNSGAAAVMVNLDATLPTAPLLSPLPTPTNVAGVTISGSAEPGSRVKISLAGALIGTVSADPQGNFTLPGVTLQEGANSCSVVATDAAGNDSATSAPLSVILDTVKPVISVTTPQAGAISSSAAVTITGSVSEPLTSLTVNGSSTPLTDLAFTSILALAAGSNSALITAVDLAGNIATATLTIQRDSTPPVVIITSPLPELLTRNSGVQVSGTVDDPEATLTVNGSPVTVTGGVFNFTYSLNKDLNTITLEATDKAGNKGSAVTGVTLDNAPPLLTITAPAEAVAGANIAIAVSASDNLQLALVELKVDGVPIWSGSSAPAISETISYRISSEMSVGAVVALQAKGVDTAGNETTAGATINITQAATGPGYIQGKVLDDARGLNLAGATVAITDAKGVTTELTTAADGGYFLAAAAGSALVKITKPGFTAVERMAAVIPEKNITLLDARLTTIAGTTNLIDAAGGVAKASPFIIHNSPFIIELTVPAGGVGSSQDLRLTPISNQALAGLLPLGWAPLAALDIRSPLATAAPETIFTAAATVKLPLPAGLAINPAAPLILARYDSASHHWLAAGTVSIDSALPLQSSAFSLITAPGQYALVLPDPAPNAPAAPVIGQALQPSAFSLQPDFDLISAVGRVVPQASPPLAGLKAAGEVVLTAKEGAAPTFTSGLTLRSRITEKYDLLSGDKVEAPVYSQDIVLYRHPCSTNIGGGAVSELPFDSAQGPVLPAVSGLALSGVEVGELRTTFPVSPSKEYTLVDLLLGKVAVEIINPGSDESGVMVGPDGGRLVDRNGNILNIPPGALAMTTPVATKTAAAVTGAVGSDFTLIRAVEVNLTRQTLALAATISFPVPEGFNQSLPLIVAKQIDVKGVAKLKLIALARQNGSFITSEPLPPQLINSSNSINSSGVYYFLQAKSLLGYISGKVSDSGSAPFTGALVKTDTGSLVDLSAASGRYLLAAPVASFTATATDLYKGDETTAAGAITAAGQVVTLDLQIAKILPTVTAITPTNGAIKVQPDVPVVVTFSKPMDKSSINSQTLKLTNSTNSESIPGSLTWNIDSKTVTFYPAEAFKQETTYSVTISGSVKDLQSYPLGQDVVSIFTVRKTTPPPMPPAGNVTATFPDSDGFITVTATQGTAPADCTLLLINDTSGEIVSLTPATNGSFTGRIRAQLGDEIKVVIMDYSGNQTLVSYITFKSDDGKYLVTAKGGKVEGEAGSSLDIPEGALAGPAIIKVTALPAANLPSQLQAPGQYLAAFNIDSGGIPFKREVKLSIPIPDGFNPATPVFVTRPSEVMNEDGTIEKVYEIIDSTKVVSGRITTASPPFDGVTAMGSYVFTAFPEVNMGIVDGYTYQEMNGQPGYQEAPNETAWNELQPGSNPLDRLYRYDRPVQRAVIRTPAAWNYVSYANEKGFYAGMTSLYGNVGAEDLEYKVTAIHPLTMQRLTNTGYLNVYSNMDRNIANLNFKLADKGTMPPDKDPPLIRIEAKKVAGQGLEANYSNGVATLGTELVVTITVTDKAMGTATLTMELSSEAYANMRTTPLTLGQPTISSAAGMNVYTYPPNFGEFFASSNSLIFKPIEKGLFRLVVSAKDASGNLASKSLDIKVVGPGEQPASLDGAPTVTGKFPPADSGDVMIDTPVKALFSEAVSGVDESSFTLFDVTANRAVSATVLPDIRDGQMQVLLLPKNNLSYGHTYRVNLTGAITDLTAVPLTPDSWQFTTQTPTAAELAGATFAARDIDYYDDIANEKKYACVAAGLDGWRVVDVTNADKMAVVWPPAEYKFPPLFDYRNLAVDQQNALLAMTDNYNLGSSDYHYGYVRFYSLADPKAPVIIGREKLAEAMSGIPGRVVLHNGYAYINTIGVGVQVVDIQAAIDRQIAGGASDGSAIVGYFDTYSPTHFGSPNFFAPYRATAAALTTTEGKLLTLDLSFPNMPQLITVSTQRNPDSTTVPKEFYYFGALATTADFAYRDAGDSLQLLDLAVAGLRAGGVRIVSLTNPANPTVIGTVKNLDDSVPTLVAREITINSALGLAVAIALDGVYVIDIRNPYDPRVLNKIVSLASGVVDANGLPVMITLNGSQAVVEKDGILYLANPVGGVKEINLGDGEKISCNPNGGCGP